MNPPALFGSSRPVPATHRSNFNRLYLDIAWFSLLSASTLSFVGVYAARLGASGFQVGLLSVGPGLANLLFALPAGRWLERQPIDNAVFWTAVLHRAPYVLWALLPLLLGAQGQIWALIGLTLAMHVPGTALAVGFNTLFAEAVPTEWRGYVAGVRNALLALGYIVVSLLCGQILTRVPFPIGYQVIFALGFVGAAMSTAQLWYITPCPEEAPPLPLPPTPYGRRDNTAAPWPPPERGTGGRADVQAAPRPSRRFSDIGWPIVGRRARQGASVARTPVLNTGVLRGSYGKLLAVVFGFHLALYLAIPLFPLHWVNNLGLTDGEIGLGTALFYVAVFLGSTQLARVSRRMGNQRATALGAVFMAMYPAFMGAASGLTLFLVGSAAGGLGWSLVGGALVNYVLEKVPQNGRPSYLAWYNLAINGALLVGALVGPVIGKAIGLAPALMIFAVMRLLGAIAIWRWE